MYLTSAAEQKRRAITASLNPTIPSLYSDKDVAAANPFLASMGEVFKGAAPRPSTVTGGKYNQASNAFFNAVHAVLAKEKPAKDALAELAGKLAQIKGAAW
jgi:trehalose/maltose transport system substrate-binding protein